MEPQDYRCRNIFLYIAKYLFYPTDDESWFNYMGYLKNLKCYDFFNPNSNMTQFFLPIKSTDTNWAFLADKPRFPIQPVVTGFFENRRSENWFCCLFSGSLTWSWAIIRITIKMKSCIHGWFHFYWVIRAVMHAKKANITKWKILFYSGIGNLVGLKTGKIINKKCNFSYLLLIFAWLRFSFAYVLPHKEWEFLYFIVKRCLYNLYQNFGTKLTECL